MSYLAQMTFNQCENSVEHVWRHTSLVFDLHYISRHTLNFCFVFFKKQDSIAVIVDITTPFTVVVSKSLQREVAFIASFSSCCLNVLCPKCSLKRTIFQVMWVKVSGVQCVKMMRQWWWPPTLKVRQLFWLLWIIFGTWLLNIIGILFP